MSRRWHFLSALAALTLAIILAPLMLQWSALAQESPADGDREERAVLMADTLYVTPSRQLVAEGHVEALHGDVRLTAQRVTYDEASGQLAIEGPIRLERGEDVTVLASAAELDRELQNGLLRGARMVLNRQVQLAAVQMNRVSGRYTQLYTTAVTSCHVCGDGRPPLWQIRARRVIHDEDEQQLYFEDARLMVRGATVMVLPRFRLPDPNVKRARGFLVPSIRSTNQLGTGMRVPYFIPLGDHRDLTLTPYLSPKTRTLGFRYRQAFRRGDIHFEGAFTSDDLTDDARGYLFGSGHFDLNHGFNLDFQIRTASDKAYLVDYGLPDTDRLRNEVAISRYRRNDAFRAGLIYYDSLRDLDYQSTLPTIVPSLRYERRWFPDRIGGELRMAIDVQGHHRSSNLNILGRDVTRSTADLNWRRNWILGPGLRADWRLGVAADFFRIYQDDRYGHDLSRVTPSSAFSLRYPMTKTTANGATQMLEPIAQIGWASTHGTTPPNDESAFVEFDEGNLLSLSRFPAPDRREDGFTFVYGVNWARFAPSGWQASASIGQVFRQDADPSFTRTSGLSGKASDILLAGQISFEQGLSVSGRTLLDSAFGISKAELRGSWSGKRTGLAGTYLWQGIDPDEGREEALSEVWLDGAYEISPNWTGRANLRYDLTDSSATRAGFGLGWQNECVAVDLSVNRRYTSSTSVEPTTDFGFTISLRGFTVESGNEKYRRSCS